MSMVANPGQRAIIKSNPEKQADLKVFFEKNKAAIMSVAAKHVTPERLMRIALSLTSRDAKLVACKPVSLFRCVVECAALGLEPGSTLGEAYLVPFKDECTLIVGYRGLIKLARQSGEIKSVRARVVYKGEDFQVDYGLIEGLRHKPNLLDVASDRESADRPDADIVAAYAVAEFIEGDPQFEVMTKAQIDKIRSRSASANSGPWVTDYAEMAKKTVVRRLSKMLPLSAEKSERFQKAVAHENAIDAGEQSPVIDVPFLEEDDDDGVHTAPPTRADSLIAKVSANGNGAKVTHDKDGVIVEVNS